MTRETLCDRFRRHLSLAFTFACFKSRTHLCLCICLFLCLCHCICICLDDDEEFGRHLLSLALVQKWNRSPSQSRCPAAWGRRQVSTLIQGLQNDILATPGQKVKVFNHCLVVLNQEGRSSRCTRDSVKTLRHGSLLCEHRRQGRARGRG